MKKILISTMLIASSGLAHACDPYYLINRGLADSSVIALYGYPDNKTPCITLEKWFFVEYCDC